MSHALFRFYPVLGSFYREAQSLEDAGPAILWYSWLVGADGRQSSAWPSRAHTWAERIAE